jgi:DNA repair protein RadC
MANEREGWRMRKDKSEAERQPGLFDTQPKKQHKDLALRETPAYRVGQDPRQCNGRELIAAIIGGSNQNKVAAELLGRFGDLTELSRAGKAELEAVPGLGPSKAVRIMAAYELSKRALHPVGPRPTLTTPDAAAQVLFPLVHGAVQESLYVLHLNTRNVLMGPPEEVYRGSLNSSLIRTGEIFRTAVRVNAAAIIVGHNHPSGDVTPSPEDVAVTKAIVEVGKLLDIEVLDHLVVANDHFKSLKAAGLMG